MPCLDTCVILDILRGVPSLTGRATAKIDDLRRRGRRLSVSRFTWAELYVGVCRSRDPAAEEAAILALLDPLTILEFDDKSARFFGSLTAQLYRTGRPIADIDILIAATALAAGELVVTRDVEHFSRIPGLVVETY